MILLQIFTLFETLNYLILFVPSAIVFFIIFYQQKIIRLNKKLKKLEENQQQILMNASIFFQEEESSRIAADLHDDVGPLLATARLYLNESLIKQSDGEQLQSITMIKQLLDDAIQTIREISHSIIPTTLKNFGLESALENIFEKINASPVVSAHAHFSNYDMRLGMEQEVLVFRILQELVDNILQHSKASTIHLFQEASPTQCTFTLRHDGVGIDQEQYLQHNQGTAALGIKNITVRIRVLEGNILFEADAKGENFKITLIIPTPKKG